jgi:hypothetical protein
MRAYMDGRRKRFEADTELMDSAAKCSMYFEINDKLTLLERTSTYAGVQVCKLVDMYGRLLYDYRARRNEAWAREDQRTITFIYELYDAIKKTDGRYMQLCGSLPELNRIYNIMLSLGIDVQTRPMQYRLDPEHCDWCLHLLQEDYHRYSYHLTVTGNGFD